MGGKCEMPWKKLGTILIRGRNRRRILQATTGGEHGESSWLLAIPQTILLRADEVIE